MGEQREECHPAIGKELRHPDGQPGAPEPVSPHRLAAGGDVPAALVPTEPLGLQSPPRSSCLLPTGRASSETGWPGTLENINSRLQPPENRDGQATGDGGGDGAE